MTEKIPFEDYWGDDPKSLIQCKKCHYKEYIATWLLCEGLELSLSEISLTTPVSYCPKCGKDMYLVK